MAEQTDQALTRRHLTAANPYTNVDSPERLREMLSRMYDDIRRWAFQNLTPEHILLSRLRFHEGYQPLRIYLAALIGDQGIADVVILRHSPMGFIAMAVVTRSIFNAISEDRNFLRDHTGGFGLRYSNLWTAINQGTFSNVLQRREQCEEMRLLVKNVIGHRGTQAWARAKSFLMANEVLRTMGSFIYQGHGAREELAALVTRGIDIALRFRAAATSCKFEFPEPGDRFNHLKMENQSTDVRLEIARTYPNLYRVMFGTSPIITMTRYHLANDGTEDVVAGGVLLLSSNPQAWRDRN